MIIRINSLESTIEIFYEKYVHLHGFLKLEAEDKEGGKEYVIIVQILSEQTIMDYVMTRQKLKHVELTEYITAELESELQYVIQGRPIICSVTDKNTKKTEDHITNVFFIIEDIMESGDLKPHSMRISEVQDTKAEYLAQIFNPEGIYMGELASEKMVKVYFPFKYLMYHFFIAGATGTGKSNLNQVFIDGLLQHNANVILSGKGNKISMLAIDMHDEYALGCLNYGVNDICKSAEYNKQLIKIGNDPKEIQENGGFLKYGVLKNQYIIVKGSIGGSKKRLIKFSHAIRPNKIFSKEPPTITHISKVSKQ